MGKRRDQTLPSTEMTSMIDIIFQLLIFFLVTLSLGTVQQTSSSDVEGEKKEDLPILPLMAKLSDTSPVTEGFLLHIDEDKEDKVKGDIVCWILDPTYPTLKEARADSSRGHGPFNLEQCTKKVKRDMETWKMMEGTIPTFGFRAYKDTPFGFVLDLMFHCNQDSIEVVDFHLAIDKDGSKGGL